MPDLNDGARAVDMLLRRILRTDDLERDMARSVLAKAQANARGRPTPQARMVAEALFARRGVIIGSAGRRIFGSGSDRPVKLGHLAYGAEFGSDTHSQFGPRRESGYWLHPAAERPNRGLDKTEDSYLDKAIDAAIRAAGP